MPLDHILVKGAREHNLKNIDVAHPARQAGRLHRPVGLGQVVARVRHDLRRGAAPLRRVAVGVRAPVPRADGEARRRLHRGAVAGDLDRPEGHRRATRARPSARSPRSTTTCACCSRASAMPHCPNARQSDRRSRRSQQIVDRILALPEGTRILVLGAGRARPQGRVPAASSRTSGKAGFVARARRRRASATSSEDDHARQDTKKHTIEVVVDRLVVRRGAKRRPSDRGSPTRVETALRLGEGVALVAIVDGEGEAETARSPSTSPARRRLLDRRDRAAQLLVQPPARRVPDVHRPRHASSRSIPSWSSPNPRLSLERRRDRCRGASRAARRSTAWRCSTAVAKQYEFSLDTPWQDAAEEGARRDPVRHRRSALTLTYENRSGQQRLRTSTTFEGVIALARAAVHARPTSRVHPRGASSGTWRAAVPRLQGHAPEARGARGHDRRTRTSTRSTALTSSECVDWSSLARARSRRAQRARAD